ncbi:hypothetical protein [Rubinisphaera italica]|uniref:Uncharacterized protein n=1 Tax=Rubinisphaera italica TaxID=2527969 RepID=A0A5C5XEP6_9PLAN|nr:hypothetical protein [Rubinisphaera italica]TWT60891.1 hypothetical protein Pan54_16220 [Rubinisphaera italica]
MDQTIDGYRVVRQYTIEEAETEYAVKIRGKFVPFGYRNEQWRKLRAQMQEGDQLWLASSPDEEWDALMGFEGILLVRNGHVVNSFVTKMN